MSAYDYQKIDPVFKTKWVAALRSGDYKQGQGNLRVEENGESYFCCLGVAADLLHQDKWESVWHPLAKYTSYRMPNGLTSGYSLLAPLREEISLTENAHAKLVSLNDGQGLSLPQIADWIEEHL